MLRASWSAPGGRRCFSTAWTKWLPQPRAKPSHVSSRRWPYSETQVQDPKVRASTSRDGGNTLSDVERAGSPSPRIAGPPEDRRTGFSPTMQTLRGVTNAEHELRTY